ncbi:MAG: polysaccharide deacetylase family protein [Verrucomicrobiae bacterium]|nr:polysaccharide deacetylase family protein [Verrucomicrobiae bacterium]
MNWKCFVLTTCIALAAGSCGRNKNAQNTVQPMPPQQPVQAMQPGRPMNPNFAGPRRLPATMDTSYRQAKVQQPFLAMTFDDGPHATNTPRLLDILRERNIRATFYVVGQNVKRYPDLLRRIVAEGHEIGNHTVSHANLTKVSDQRLRMEMGEVHNGVLAVTGVAPQTMRPPYGALRQEQRALIRREFGYPTITWNVDPEDWKRPGVGVVTKRLVEGARPGGILLAHDIHAPTIDAMPGTLDELLRRGFRFVTVSELINIEQSQAHAPAQVAAAQSPLSHP